MDGLACIGRNPGDEANVYIDSGVGTTDGIIAGILIKDLIVGHENPCVNLYDPSRKTLRATLTFARETLNVAAEYANWITPEEVHNVDEIKPGTGAIVRDGLSKVAVYRDHAGNLSALSAVCIHLGCIVAWNAAEKSWDCPCHGSRFDPEGRVLNGPGALKAQFSGTNKGRRLVSNRRISAALRDSPVCHLNAEGEVTSMRFFVTKMTSQFSNATRAPHPGTYWALAEFLER